MTTRYIPKNVKDTLFQQFLACQHCGETKESLESNGTMIHIDHIVPYSQGGSNDVDNLQLLCQPCNQTKGVKTDAMAKTRHGKPYKDTKAAILALARTSYR